MDVGEVHTTVEGLLGYPVSRDSVNSCLSTGARGARPNFERVGPGRDGLNRAASREPRRRCPRYRSSAKAGVSRPSGDTLATRPERQRRARSPCARLPAESILPPSMHRRRLRQRLAIVRSASQTVLLDRMFAGILWRTPPDGGGGSDFAR